MFKWTFFTAPPHQLQRLGAGFDLAQVLGFSRGFQQCGELRAGLELEFLDEIIAIDEGNKNPGHTNIVWFTIKALSLINICVSPVFLQTEHRV